MEESPVASFIRGKKGCGEEEKGCGEEEKGCGEEKHVYFGATVRVMGLDHKAHDEWM